MRITFTRHFTVEIDNQTSVTYPAGLTTSQVPDEIAKQAVEAGAAIDLEAPEPEPAKPAPKKK